MSTTNEECIEMLRRLELRIARLELNREFTVKPIMVSERDQIADLVSLAALRFSIPESAIVGKNRNHKLVAPKAMAWVIHEAHKMRKIPTDIIAFVLKKPKPTVEAIVRTTERADG